jgi:hypothetical protein
MNTKPIIENPNSSGQGYHLSHLAHPLHSIIIGCNYSYSHSTPIGVGSGWYLLHTYIYALKDATHTVSIKTDITGNLFWSTSCGGSTKYGGHGKDELKAHLVRKAQRYSMILIRNYDGYVVTGKTRDGKRFVKTYGADGYRWAMGINLWAGSVWGVKDSKRTLIKRVCN